MPISVLVELAEEVSEQVPVTLADRVTIEVSIPLAKGFAVQISVSLAEGFAIKVSIAFAKGVTKQVSVSFVPLIIIVHVGIAFVVRHLLIGYFTFALTFSFDFTVVLHWLDDVGFKLLDFIKEL